jgi:hypothetical protein
MIYSRSRDKSGIEPFQNHLALFEGRKHPDAAAADRYVILFNWDDRRLISDVTPLFQGLENWFFVTFLVSPLRLFAHAEPAPAPS